MTAFVLDASVTMAWCFEDEASTATWALLDRAAKAGAIVPGLWPLEVGNILAQAERRGRTTASRIRLFVQQLSALPIQIDDETASRGFGEVLSLARTEKLTTYDSAYLELAMRRGLPVATKDEALAMAATRNGVELLPTR